MHMADALMSPAVGVVMWTATAATTVYCAKRIREEDDPGKIPLMGVTGAFIFAAQMLNFTIPGTGSSGHLGGGLILAILLGPHAAFLVMASVLSVQALFFADGGLLALGANILNLGFIPAFLAYPLVYKPIVGLNPSRTRLIAGSVAGAVVALQLGALGVVLETWFSGVSELPFAPFAALMLPIHLGIGLAEGAVTAAVVLFVRQAQPELLGRTAQRKPLTGLSLRPVIAGLAIAAVLSGVALSWFASASPDGLEWSIARVTGNEEFAGDTTAAVHDVTAAIQEKTAFLPDYEPRRPGGKGGETAATWPSVNGATSVAGLVGAAITLGFAGLIGYLLSRRRRAALRRAG